MADDDTEATLSERARRWSFESFLVEVAGEALSKAVLVSISHNYERENNNIIDEYDAHAPKWKSSGWPRVPLEALANDPHPQSPEYEPDIRTDDDKRAAERARSSILKINAYVIDTMTKMPLARPTNELMSLLSLGYENCYKKVLDNIAQGKISWQVHEGLAYLNFNTTGPVVRDFFRGLGFSEWKALVKGVLVYGKIREDTFFNNSNKVVNEVDLEALRNLRGD